MSANLNVFPVRIPIGTVTDTNGKELDVLMTREFAKALAALMVRVGGPNGMDVDELAALASSDDPANHVSRLRAEVAELRAALEQLAPALALQRQIDAMRVELAMIEDPAAVIRYILVNYAPLLSPAFKGIPTAPTAALDTKTDQLATCKFVLNQASDTVPLMDAVAAAGVSPRYSRTDHVHPSDSTKQGAIAAATVTGSRGGNAALTSLLTGLAGQGLIVNSTTA